jgi:CheY-like chemotaxis protein
MSSSDRSTVLLLMSQADVEMIDAALRPLNVDVLCAHDLREARKRVSTAQPIDVVVTDVTLPDGNWSDVIRWVVAGRAARHRGSAKGILPGHMEVAPTEAATSRKPSSRG